METGPLFNPWRCSDLTDREVPKDTPTPREGLCLEVVGVSGSYSVLHKHLLDTNGYMGTDKLPR